MKGLLQPIQITLTVFLGRRRAVLQGSDQRPQLVQLGHVGLQGSLQLMPLCGLFLQFLLQLGQLAHARAVVGAGHPGVVRIGPRCALLLLAAVGGTRLPEKQQGVESEKQRRQNCVLEDWSQHALALFLHGGRGASGGVSGLLKRLICKRVWRSKSPEDFLSSSCFYHSQLLVCSENLWAIKEGNVNQGQRTGST